MIFWHTQASRSFFSLSNSAPPPFPKGLQNLPFYYAGHFSPVSTPKFPFLNACRASAEQGRRSGVAWSLIKLTATKDPKKQMKLFFMFFLQTKTCILLVASGEGPLWKHFPAPCDSDKSSKFHLFLCQVSFRTHTVKWLEHIFGMLCFCFVF